MTTYYDRHQTEYICADDLKGQPRTLEIARVDLDAKHWNNGRRESCEVVYFKGAKKGLRVNATIYQTIAFELGYGEHYEDWVGRRIIVYPTTDDRRRGPDKRVVRVKSVVPSATVKAEPAPEPAPVPDQAAELQAEAA